LIIGLRIASPENWVIDDSRVIPAALKHKIISALIHPQRQGFRRRRRRRGP